MDPLSIGLLAGGSLLSGLFGGKKKATTTQQVQFPEEFKPLASDLGALSQFLMQRPFTPYLGQRRAGLSPMTQAAIGRGYEIGMGQNRDYTSGMRFGGGRMPMPPQQPPGFSPYPQGPMGGGQFQGGMPPGATPVPQIDRPNYDPRQAMYGVGQSRSSAGPRQLGALSQFGSGFRR